MDTFEIIYRTSQTESSPGTTTPAPSDVSWGDVKSKPFSSIGSRLSVSGNTLSADIQTWAQITGKPFTTLGDSLKVEGGVLDIERVTEAIRASRATDLTIVEADEAQWLDLEFDAVEVGGSTIGLNLLTGNTTFQYDGEDDTLYISGHIRPLWTGPGGQVSKVACRIVFKDPLGSFTENKFIQASMAYPGQVESPGSLDFSGTLPVIDGTQFKLQVWLQDEEMKLSGDTVFDSPTSVVLEAHALNLITEEET